MLRSGARLGSRASIRGSVAYQQHGRQRLVQQQLMPAAATSLEQRRGFLPGPLVRLIAQVAVSAAGVFSRAFMQAYQEAAANAQKGSSAVRAARGKMTESEALLVLNLDEPWTPEQVQAQYDKYFVVNDPEKGGSFYIQSKVVRAKETLDEIYLEQQAEREEA